MLIVPYNNNLDNDNYLDSSVIFFQLLKIQPEIIFAFQCMSNLTSAIVNLARPIFYTLRTAPNTAQSSLNPNTLLLALVLVSSSPN